MAISAAPSSKNARCKITIKALAAVLAVCLAMACFTSGQAFAATASTNCSLYASTSGSDNNSGTASAPFATVKHLMEKLSPGQTGCLTSGQTFAGFTLYEGNTHGAEGAPITVTSTNPEDPATIDGRVTTEKGSNWLTFTHLNLIYGQDTLLPGVTIGSAHTTWTYDNVSGGDLNICFLTNPVGDSYGAGEYTVIENDRVHDCGHPVTEAELTAQANDTYEGRENGWHVHGLYDEGVHSTVKNSYFYDNSGVGILLRSGGFAVVEHNVIDANGRGVELGNEGSQSDTIAWNIITNTTSPCGREVGSGSHCDTYGLSTSGEVGSGSAFRHNDLYGNEGGNIEPGINSIIAREGNVEVNPLYANAASHEYTLKQGSPAAGYGPSTAQPTSSTPAEVETPVTPPVNTEAPVKTETPATPPTTEAPATPPVKTETPVTPPTTEAPVTPPAKTETPVTTPAKTETPVTTPVKTETTTTKRQYRHGGSFEARDAARTASVSHESGHRAAKHKKHKRHSKKKGKS